MNQPTHYIACDLGAESGRVMLGTLEAGQLSLQEIHRFVNGPVRVNGTLRWDVLRLFDELKAGLAKAPVKAESLSCDSWGVDYVWLKDNEPLLTAPFHYRDARTYDYEKHFANVPAETIFAETGIQFMHINTLYQLAADAPWLWKCADRFLMIGDYFNYLFSGVAKAEESLASTSQIYSPKKHAWSKKLIRRFKFNKRVFPEVVPSGTVLGSHNGIKVIATCSHDTGAAVAAVPATGNGWAYLSSGTWSLLGVEAKKPIINEKSRQYNFTNEVGYGGRIRFLKNIIGLWIQQECRRAWGNKNSYVELAKLAEQAAPLKSLINPNDPRFGQPDNMPDKIAAFCRETGQPAPASEGEFIRCVLESLALLYRQTLDQLEDVTGKPIQTLHIVGGGSQNALLNQFSANATGRTVIAGPAEATATGNILIQAIALGHLKDLDELRQVVRNSFEVRTFKPQGDWTSAIEKFSRL
jgi:rhamnulokinase